MLDHEHKKKLLSELEKLGMVRYACAKAGISRATYYRWLAEDKHFRKKAQRSLRHGRENNNEMAEMSLLSMIRDKNLGAIKYWLSHSSPRYKQRRVTNATIDYRIPQRDAPKQKGLDEILRERAIERLDSKREQDAKNKQG